MWSWRVKDELNSWAALYKRVGLPARLSFNAFYDGASSLTSDFTVFKLADQCIKISAALATDTP